MRARARLSSRGDRRAGIGFGPGRVRAGVRGDGGGPWREDGEGGKMEGRKIYFIFFCHPRSSRFYGMSLEKENRGG